MKPVLIGWIVTLGFVFSLIAFFLGWGPGSESKGPKLQVYTYSSFVSSWGPGGELEKLFEKYCACDVVYSEASDAGLLLERVKMETPQKSIDLVLGFDQLDLARAQSATAWRTIESASAVVVDDSLKPIFEGTPFLPLDWAPLTINIQKSKMPAVPKTPQDLLKPEVARNLILQDPRISSPGFQFLIWIMHLYGPEKGRAFLEELLPQVHQVSPSWSSAYGLFSQGLAPAVWSYFTSPLVHQIEDKSDDYEALVLGEHPVQVELMGVPAGCDQCGLAEEFVLFLLSDPAQKILMQKNYMLPVRHEITRGTLFSKVPMVPVAPIDYRHWGKQRNELLQMWSEIRRKKNEDSE